MKFAHVFLWKRATWLHAALFATAASCTLWAVPAARAQQSNQPPQANTAYPDEEVDADNPNVTTLNVQPVAPAAQNNAAGNLDQKSGALGISLAQERDGVRIIGLQRNSPAMQAGLQVGDKLQAIDGTRWNTVDDVIDQISARWPNSRVQLQVDRQGTSRTLDATLASRAAILHEDQIPQNQPQFGQFQQNQPQFGQFQQPNFQASQFQGNVPSYQAFSVDPRFAGQPQMPQQCLQRGAPMNTTTAQVPTNTVPQ